MDSPAAAGPVQWEAGSLRLKLGLEELGGPLIAVELDVPNEHGEKVVHIPASFARFDHGYALTTHRAQGRTLSSAYALVNPSMSDREWTYVAASRSRFATTLFVNTALLGLVDPESHRPSEAAVISRDAAIDALASRMRRSRAKGTSLDYDPADIRPGKTSKRNGSTLAAKTLAGARILFKRLGSRGRDLEQELTQRR